MQCILWLSKPLSLESKEVTILAAILEGRVGQVAHVRSGVGTIEVEFAHILVAESVTDAMTFVDDHAGFADLRGLS